VSLNGRLDPGIHAMVQGLPQKLEYQGIQVLVDGLVAVTYTLQVRDYCLDACSSGLR